MNVAAILKIKGRAVATVRTDATLQDVAEKLAKRKIGAMVIIGPGGRISGIVSERDVVRVIAEHGAKALAMSVSSVMTTDVITCSETDMIDDVMATMTERRFRHVPVVESGGLVGIVSIGDVVKHHIAEVELEASAMKSYLAAG